MTTTPKPKGNKLDYQTKKIVQLLTVWPTASYSTIEKYISDVLKVSCTRACIQQAKEALGLHTPDHEEKTLAKKAYAEHTLLVLVSTHGIGGLKQTQYCSRVAEHLENAFGEKTNVLLLKNWVADMMNEIKGVHISRYAELIAASQEELQKLGIISEEDNRQVKLL